MNIKLSVPVYYQQTKSKKVLIGMNWYHSAHYNTYGKFKKEYSYHIKSQLAEALPITSKYTVIYRYFYKNPASDLTNVCSLVSKVFNDALQEAGIVSDDSVKVCVKETFLVAHKDAHNPRVEIEVIPELF